MFDDRMRFLAVSRRFLSDFELGETVKVIGRSPARPLLRSLETLSGALMSASGRSQPIKTYSSETSGRESMPRRWRAPSSRIWQILSALSRIRPAGQRMGNQNSYRRRDPEPRSVGQPGNLCLGSLSTARSCV